MIEIILSVVVLALSGALAFLFFAQRKINKKYHKLFDTIVHSITIQQDVNSKQLDINDLLGKNLEILGVHTKLIPPSVTMQAEAFLRWHNERKNDE